MEPSGTASQGSNQCEDRTLIFTLCTAGKHASNIAVASHLNAEYMDIKKIKWPIVLYHDEPNETHPVIPVHL